jgi:putative zinc finger/helix-turn-helix YgiT family protein
MTNTTKRLRCPECDGGYLKEQLADLVGTRKGEPYTVRMEALVCPKCGFKTVSRENAAQFALQTADAYRKRHGLLTSMEIRDLRTKLGMTQLQFAEFLPVGIASVKRWELGEIQDPAMNRLMLLAVAEEERKRKRTRRPRLGSTKRALASLAKRVPRSTRPARAVSSN